MTAQVVEPDVDTTVLDLLDFDLPCAVTLVKVVGPFVGRPSKQCEDPAKYTLRCRKCRNATYVCTGHAVAIQALDYVLCAHCKTSGPGIALYEVTPLAVR